jgi:hypothetical protein
MLWSLLLTPPLLSQGVTGFYPLDIGDYWEYLDYGWMGELQDTISYSVDRDTLICGRSYRVLIINSFKFRTGTLSFQRIDESGNLMTLSEDTTEEILTYRFADTSKTFWLQNQFLARFDVLKTTTFSGNVWRAFEVHHYSPYDSSEIMYVEEVVENLGLFATHLDEFQGGVLRGARIAGVVHGTITSVQPGLGSQPSAFALEQNYPNPFNGTTAIRFSLPTAGDVRIDIFNVLGQQVDSRYWSRLSQGQHTIHWDSANLPSGSYIYRLDTQSASAARMLMIIR